MLTEGASLLVGVVGGITVRHGRILLTQRRADVDFPLTWECPGGKVEGNESYHAALCREWKEELGVTIEEKFLREEAWWSREFHNPVSRPDRRHVFLLLYLVHRFGGTPIPCEGQGLGWFSESELKYINTAPGLEVGREHVIKAMRALNR